MSAPKKCIFVKERTCPFQSTQISLETCQLCIEAWKTEVAIQKQRLQGTHVTPVYDQQAQQPNGNSVAVPTVDENGTAVINEKLKEIDELLKNDKIDPLEYIKLRKEQVNNIIEGRPKVKLDEIVEQPQEILPAPRMVRVAVITKSLLRKQIYTAPENWELPKKITGKVIDSIFKMTEQKNAVDIRLRVGEYKIAGIASEKNELVIMVLDADEEFESYQAEIMRVYDILRKGDTWKDALKKIHA